MQKQYIRVYKTAKIGFCVLYLLKNGQLDTQKQLNTTFGRLGSKKEAPQGPENPKILNLVKIGPKSEKFGQNQKMTIFFKRYYGDRLTVQI